MASDNLKQVGKYIGKTSKTADRALKRARPIQPRLERVRDVFDSAIPFEMNFKKLPNDERVMLDLFFNLPPPSRGCKVGCIFTKCEEFTFESGGDHSVTLTHSYLPGSLSIFINGDKLDNSHIGQPNPTAGEVFFQGTSGPDIVAICYVYTECPEDSNNPECPALGPSFAGATLAFSDRFDRPRSLETWGGLGYWFDYGPNFSQIGIPIEAANNGGVLRMNGVSKQYMFENIQGSGTIFEILALVDLTNIEFFNDNSDAYITIGIDSFMATNASVTIYSTGQVSVDKPFTYERPSDTTTGTVFLNSWLESKQSPIDVRQKLYVRYFFDTQVHRVKLWPYNEPEPTAWLEFTAPIIYFLGTNTKITGVDFVGGTIFGTFGPSLVSIQHWVGTIGGVQGYWNHFGEASNSYRRTICHSSVPGPVGTYFDLCDTEQDFLTEYGTGTGTLITTGSTYPTHSIGLTFDQFSPGTGVGYPSNSTQTIASYDYNVGKSSSVKISGDIRWRIDFSSTKFPDSLAINLQSFNYGDVSQPSSIGQVMFGTTQTVIRPGNATGTGGDFGSSASEWVAFEVTIPVSDGKIQWGPHFQDTSEELSAKVGGHTGFGFLPRRGHIEIDFRYLNVQAVEIPIGGAKPFCPETETLAERCGPFYGSFLTNVYDYTCNVVTTSFLSGSGAIWTLRQNDGIRTETQGNSLKFLFRATGITDDGSDGRCPRFSDAQSGATSWSNSNARLSISNSPAVCGSTSLTAQFKFGELGEIWSSTFGEQYPEAELDFGDALGNIYAAIVISRDPDSNIVRFDNRIYNRTLSSNTLYNLRVESSYTFKAKIWRADEAEPAAWDISTINSSGGQNSTFRLTPSYTSFIDDDFTIEVFNIVETVLV